MATQNIIYSAAANYNGGWSSWGNASGYAGNNSSANYAVAIRFQTPSFAGTPQQLSFSVPVIQGYTNIDATIFVSLTSNDPTQSGAYNGNTPGADSGQIYSAAQYIQGLGASISYINLILPAGSVRPSTTYYLVLSADRPAREGNNYIQVYGPQNVSGTLEYQESASTIAVSTSRQEMGKTVAFSINRANSAYTHTLKRRIKGADSWTTFAENVGISYTWTIPLGLASLIPSTASGVWEIQCETKLGDRSIGTAVLEMTLIVPASVVPSIGSFTRSMVSDNATVTSWGIFVQSLSSLRLQLSAAASYSTISRWEIKWADGTLSGSNAGASISIDQTTQLLASTGTLNVVATVTDARGRSTTRTLSYTVHPYAPPSAAAIEVVRSTVSGTPSDAGTYIAVTATSVISSCGGKNSVRAFTTTFKERGAASFYSPASLTSGVKRVIGGGIVNITKSYTVRITVQDQLNTINIDTIVPTQRATINAKSGGLAVAFGKYAETDNSVELAEGWKLILNDSGGNSAELDYSKLAALLDLVEGSVIDKIHPIGSIWMCYENTSPADAFGGTWEQITGRFLYAAGPNTQIKSTGGAASHNHGEATNAQNGSLVAQIGYESESNNMIVLNAATAPEYAGNVYNRGTSTWGTEATIAMTHAVKVSGQTASKTVLPPYLAVNMWRRTA